MILAVRLDNAIDTAAYGEALLTLFCTAAIERVRNGAYAFTHRTLDTPNVMTRCRGHFWGVSEGDTT